MKRVLNVGGNSKAIAIPPYYGGWEHHLLDVDPRGKPDLLMDARALKQLAAATYDAVYCSHNLEHYHRADGAKVVEGFAHVLKDDGFAEIRVPDVLAVIRHVAGQGMDLDDVLYTSPSGPILVRDVLYGYHVQVEHMGNEFFAHKTGFSPRSLLQFVAGRGFEFFGLTSHGGFEFTAYLFKQPPSAETWAMLGLDPAARP